MGILHADLFDYHNYIECPNAIHMCVVTYLMLHHPLETQNLLVTVQQRIDNNLPLTVIETKTLLQQFMLLTILYVTMKTSRKECYQ